MKAGHADDDGAAHATGPRGKIRVGLFGGTFDPPHYGHLIAAQEALYQLHLSRVLFLPARQNPLKQGEESASPEDRSEMVALAIRGNKSFLLSRADLDRPAPSYTADLLVLLQEELGPQVDMYFLAGSDILQELPSWHRPDAILRHACVVAMTRPGWPAPDQLNGKLFLPDVRERVISVTIPGVDISSTELRRRARMGQPLRYLTPPGVERYIRERSLYRSSDGAARNAERPHKTDTSQADGSKEGVKNLFPRLPRGGAQKG